MSRNKSKIGIFEFSEIILSISLKLCPARFQKTAHWIHSFFWNTYCLLKKT